MTQISSLSVGLDLKDTGFARGINGAVAKVKGLATAVVGVSVGLAAFSARTLGGVDTINKLADRTNVSVEQLSLLETQLALSDVSAEQLGKGVERLQRTIGDAARGFKAPTEALAELGLVAADLQKLDITGQLGLIADRLNAIQDPAKRASIGYGVLGRQFKVLAPFLNLGSKGMQEQAKQLSRLGLIMDKVSADQASGAIDALTKLSAVTSRFGRVLAVAFAPELTSAIERFLEVLPDLLEGVRVAFASTGAFIGAFAAQVSTFTEGITATDFFVSPIAALTRALSNNGSRAASIDPADAASRAAIGVFESGISTRSNPANFTSGGGGRSVQRGGSDSGGEIITLLRSIDNRLIDLKARAS